MVSVGAPMTLPDCDARLAVARMQMALLRNWHRSYLSDLRFPEAVEASIIAVSIMTADVEDKPFTALGLAKNLQMPRATLLRRLSVLESEGIIRRDGRHLRINPGALTDDSMRRVRKIVTRAWETLTKVDTRSSARIADGSGTRIPQRDTRMLVAQLLHDIF